MHACVGTCEVCRWACARVTGRVGFILHFLHHIKRHTMLHHATHASVRPHQTAHNVAPCDACFSAKGATNCERCIIAHKPTPHHSRAHARGGRSAVLTTKRAHGPPEQTSKHGMSHALFDHFYCLAGAKRFPNRTNILHTHTHTHTHTHVVVTQETRERRERGRPDTAAQRTELLSAVRPG